MYLVNIYLLAKAIRMPIKGKSRRRRQHRQFQEALAEALMAYHEAPEHNKSEGLLEPTVPIAGKIESGNQSTKSEHLELR